MAENTKSSGCLQRDSAEHEGYAKDAQVIQSDMERKRQCTAEALGSDTV